MKKFKDLKHFNKCMKLIPTEFFPSDVRYLTLEDGQKVLFSPWNMFREGDALLQRNAVNGELKVMAVGIPDGETLKMRRLINK